MGHDPVGGRTLGGVDGPHPSWQDMPIGKAAEIERFVLAILALDNDAPPDLVDPQ